MTEPMTWKERRDLAVENATRFIDLAERKIGDPEAMVRNARTALRWLNENGIAVPDLAKRYARLAA